MSSTTNQLATSKRPSSVHSYAPCVGRVGALAIALGVGLAVASTPGIAYADDSTDGTASADTPTSTNESTTTGTSSAESGETAAGPRQTRRSERNRITRVFGANPSGPSRRTRDDRSAASGRGEQTNVDINEASATSGDDAASADNKVIVGEVKEAEGSASTTLRNTTSKKSADDVVRHFVSPRRAQLPAPTTRMNVNTHVDKTTALKAPVQPSITATTAIAVNQSPAAGSAGRVANPTLAAVAPVTPTTPTPVARPAALVSGFLAAVGLAPSLTSPTTPPRAPAAFVWAVLGFVRRELEQVQRTYLNRTPDARDDAVSTSEDTAVTFDPLTNDVDPDRGDVKTITSYSQPEHGALVRNADGTFTYQPNANYNGTDSFTYTATDEASARHVHGLLGALTGGGHTDTATVNITVTAVNDAPVASGGQLRSTDEDNVSHRHSAQRHRRRQRHADVLHRRTAPHTAPSRSRTPPPAPTPTRRTPATPAPTHSRSSSRMPAPRATLPPSTSRSTRRRCARGECECRRGGFGDRRGQCHLLVQRFGERRLTATTPRPQLGQLIPTFGSIATDGTTQSIDELHLRSDAGGAACGLQRHGSHDRDVDVLCHRRPQHVDSHGHVPISAARHADHHRRRRRGPRHRRSPDHVDLLAECRRSLARDHPA